MSTFQLLILVLSGFGENGDSVEANGPTSEAEIIANIMGQLQSGE